MGRQTLQRPLDRSQRQGRCGATGAREDPVPTATRGRGGDAYGSVGCLLAKGRGVRCGCQGLSVHTGG